MQILLKYGVPLLISAGLCYLLFTGVDFADMARIIRQDCNFTWILIALVCSIISHVIRAARWGIQLSALGIRPGLFPLTLSIFGTYAVNLVLPRLGELWRTGWIAQRQKASFTTVFGSMVADRLADTITVIILTGMTFIVAHRQLVNYLSQNTESYERIAALLASPWLWAWSTMRRSTASTYSTPRSLPCTAHACTAKPPAPCRAALSDSWRG